jgi:hypothetical protein
MREVILAWVLPFGLSWSLVEFLDAFKLIRQVAKEERHDFDAAERMTDRIRLLP